MIIPRRVNELEYITAKDIILYKGTRSRRTSSATHDAEVSIFSTMLLQNLQCVLLRFPGNTRILSQAKLWHQFPDKKFSNIVAYCAELPYILP